MNQSAATPGVSVQPLPESQRPLVPPILKWLPPVVSSLNQTTAAPGDTIVVTGQGFGDTQGAGYVLFSDNGVNWGQPGDLAAFQLLSWSNTEISFLVPVTDSRGYQTVPGTTATVTVTNGGGLHSNVESLAIQSAAPAIPVISSINPTTAGPGDTIVIDGQNFGAQQGAGCILFADNGVNWGQPGDLAAFQIVHWSDTQISFIVPTKDSHGYQVTPGTSATVTVTNSSKLTSSQQNLALHSAVKWPVSANSGVTTIGTTGNGFMQTAVTIDQAGNLTANTQVWDTSSWGPLTGFHGACVVRLYDTFGNVIGTFPAGPYGVEGGQNNPNAWSATLTPAACAELYSISIVNFYDPQYNVPGEITTWIENNASSLATAAKAIVAAV